MNLHEYQTKALLARYGVPVLSGIVVRTPKEALEAFKQLKGQSAVIKVQIHAGARGKAGGVRVVHSSDEAFDVAKSLLGQYLVTEQTGPEGQLVGSVLVCENVYPVAQELYLAATVDRTNQCIAFMASSEGGVDIEAVAATHPEKIFKILLDPLVGMQPHKARLLAFNLGLTGAQINEWVAILQGAYRAFVENDATLLEINPLSIDYDGHLSCIDAKMTIDENALYRVPQLTEIFDATQLDIRERKAAELDLNYVTLEGNIGCMVNGAGLAMATMDIIKLYGGNPANFLDVGGDATKERVIDAFQLIMADPMVAGILINIFGGIVRCDMIATAIIEAVHSAEIKVPVVVRLAGNGATLGAQLLRDSGLTLIPAEGLADGAQKIVAAVAAANNTSIAQGGKV